MRTHLKKQAFTIGLFCVVALAMLFPGPATQGGILHSEFTTKLGVWFIFFFQGLNLPTSQLVSGYKPKRLHLFVIGWNYLLFPLVVALFFPLLSLVLKPELCLGFGLLALLPTTIVSSVTFSSISGGNTSNAIFSSILSNLISVVWVPVVVVAYLAVGQDVEVPLGPLLKKLSILIILPLLLGQVIRRFSSEKALAVFQKTKPMNSWIILFIVHAAFANSVSAGFLETLSVASILIVIASSISLLLVVSSLVWWSSLYSRFETPERITAFFCASQKSLATGLPLATSILAATSGHVDVAVLLVPLMCYHPAQLILAGLLSQKFSSDTA